MKIKTLKAKNFWSYQTIDFNFDKGLCLVDGYNFDEIGSNGAGKSGLFNAVCYGLFGDLPKKIKSDDVISRFSDRDCVVILEIENNNKKYVIERGRKPNILKFYINGCVQADIDSKQTQKLIEKEFGFSFDTFLNSVYFSQNSSSFLHLNDENKKSILTNLLELHIFDKAYSLVKNDTSKVEVELSIKSSKYQTYQSDIEKIKNQSVVYQNKSRYFDNEKSEKIETLNIEKHKINSEIQGKEDELKILENDLQTATSEEIVFLKNFDEKIEILKQAEKILSENNTHQNELKAQINILLKDINKFVLSYDQCPTCLQKINHQLLVDIRNEKEKEVEGLKIKLIDLQKEIESSPSQSDVVRKRVDLINKKDQLKVKIEVIKRTHSLNTSILEQLKKRESDILKQIDIVQSESNPYVEIYKDFFIQIQQSESIINNIIEEITILQNKNVELNQLLDVFGNKGIKAYVFDSIVSELNIITNDYLKDLFCGDVRIEFSSFNENSKGVTKQALTQKIFVNNQEVSLGSFSGGEEKRLIFAVNLALSQIVSSRSNKNFNVVFFDEVFDGLDFEGKKNTYLLLSKVFKDQCKKDSILVIDHNTEFQTMFENVIKIEKRDGISQIIE